MVDIKCTHPVTSKNLISITECIGKYAVFVLITFSSVSSLKLLSHISTRTKVGADQSLAAPLCS